MLNVKQLGIIGEPETRTVFYFSLTASVGSGAWMLFDAVHAITPQGLAILLGMGSTATLAQLAMTRAYRVGKTLVVGSLAYSTIVFASLFGMLIWNEVLPLSSWLGMAFIIAGRCVKLTPCSEALNSKTTREKNMITIEQTENLVNIAVLGEFTIADFKTFEEQTLYKLKSPGELDLLFDLRAMVALHARRGLGRDQVLPPRTQTRFHQDRRGHRQPVAHLAGMAVAHLRGCGYTCVYGL